MTAPTRRATVVVNPAARRVRGRFDPERALAHLGERGVTATIVTPDSAEAATTAAREAGERGDDFLFVVGGDGTMRDAATGLAGSKTALAALPAGTVNIWARETGLPGDLWEALDAHLGGQTLPVDLGVADGRHFLLMAGIGWDAAVTREVPSRMKRRLGDIAYVLQAAGMLPRLRPAPARWTVDGESHDEPVAMMIIGNTRLYGGVVQFTKAAFVDDGYLDVIALCPGTIVDATRLSMKTLTGRLGGDHHVAESRGRQVRVETPGIPVQIDGDFFGETPMEFSVEPAAVWVSVPAGRLPAIFSGEAVAAGAAAGA
jgi:YegS/Rv2252/BmrU family lipid kinase